MKTGINLKTVLLASLTIAGMNIFSSCDSCNRKEDSDTTTGTMEGEGAMTAGDTINNDHVGNTTEDMGTGTSAGTGSGASGTTGRGTTGSSGAGNAGTGGTGSSGTSGNTGREAGNGGESTGYGDSNSPIENSNTPSVKQGRPVQSGGSAGSGMGTGTGSTGNNSRVSRPEDQRN